jgi:hypothetical protein
MWLHGLAGTGKSTLAATVAQSLEESRHLGASFFSRSDAERSDPQAVFGTIASQLAARFPSLLWKYLKSFEMSPWSPTRLLISFFQKLIYGPLKTAAKDLASPVIVLLDALDECTLPSAILAPIQADIMGPPSKFRLLITSRPEQVIRKYMEDMGSAVSRYGLNHDLSVDHDIGAFLKDRLSAVARDHRLDHDWPGDIRRQSLVQKAGGPFIWASTAVRIIGDEDVEDPESQLLSLLDSKIDASSSFTWRNLDTLYLQVLHQAFSHGAQQTRYSLFRAVVGAIVTIKNPLTASALCVLLGLNPKPETSGHYVRRTLRRLQSVLIVPNEEPLQIIHPSFVDFMTDTRRCVDINFTIDSSHQHHSLAMHCLQRMISGLIPNICNLNPSLLNSEISDLADRISRSIPEALQYSCRFWADHLIAVHPTPDIFVLLRAFYFDRILCWIEVMSLLGALQDVSRITRDVEAWVLVGISCDFLNKLELTYSPRSVTRMQTAR